MSLLLLSEKACLGGDPAQMRCARRQQAPAFLFSAHLSPRAKPSMGGSVFALVQSPGTAAEAAAISLKSGVSREEGLLLLLSPVALALEAFPGEEAAEHPPPLPLQGVFWGQEGWDPHAPGQGDRCFVCRTGPACTIRSKSSPSRSIALQSSVSSSLSPC